jgi:hypothetical protein
MAQGSIAANNHVCTSVGPYPEEALPDAPPVIRIVLPATQASSYGSEVSTRGACLISSTIR